MHSSRSTESDTLNSLLRTVDKKHFLAAIHRLHKLFALYAGTCPVPLPAPGLIITPEVRNQCECYLPVAEVTSVFNRLYSSALSCQPILSSTPFHNAMSWADVFAAMPAEFQVSANPAQLLETLLGDGDMLARFLFSSFLPERFYGTGTRYPGQQTYIRNWLGRRRAGPLNCLDAACGIGEETYALALLIAGCGIPPEQVLVAGWTLEPLEVWCATYRRFPHDRRRETALRETTDPLMQGGYGRRIGFCCRDILKVPDSAPQHGDGRPFDMILCNGLLGGPIIHEKEQLDLAVGNLASLLAPGGVMLAADSFHGGWKQKCPQSDLRAFFEKYGLKTCEAGEGIGGLKSYH